MGMNNKQRRAAKAKDRQRARSRRLPDQNSEPTSGPRWDDRAVAELIQLASHFLAAGDERAVTQIVTRLGLLPAPVVRAATEAELRRAIAASWGAGWQPAELARHIGRESSPVVVRLLHAAIAADHAPRATSTLDPRWVAQLDDLGLTITSDRGHAWVEQWAHAARLDRARELWLAFQLLVLLRSLSVLDEVIPPPGGPTARAARRADSSSPVDRAILDRVRALLVKAESTTFEAEAEAFTAKAHELIARHAIDAALLDAERVGSGRGESPVTVRIAIDEPYVDAKSLLLQVVAEASRCRALFHTRFAFSSVIGFATDVAATELLYTSLLLQAQMGLAAAARSAVAGSRPRSRSFRSAFLVAYANRIGQRLEEINHATIAEAEHTSGRSVLPVLRDRQSAIDDLVAERYGALTSSRVRRGYDAAGWASGRQAADHAQLNLGQLQGGLRR
ncbi:MAG: DUF2786 domain-containing protein [Ilumatobacteraceae bacterium]